MEEKVTIQWLKEPEEHDYPAAQSYLSLIFKKSEAEKYVRKLRKARLTKFPAKDVFRASGLSLLGISNLRVKNDQEKIRSGKALSPLLLVRDSANGRVIIADGYHRMCAVYSFYEDAVINCKIV